MNLLRFIDCCTTMLFEEFQRVGQDVFEAFETTKRWAARTLATDEAPQAKPAVVEHVPSATENARSMQTFMGMLSGTGGMPG